MKKLSFFAAAVILLAGCTQAPKNEYVKLSDAACTFRAADNLPQTVRVNASGSWTAESGASWLTVEQQADALVLTVADNDTDYDRSTEILIASGRAEASISVSQLAADSNIARLRVLKTFSGGTVMSKSGRYVGGIISELQPDESYCYYPVIIDLQTDEWTKTGPFPSALYMLLRPYAISDQGLFFCFNAQNGSSPGIDLQGNVIMPKQVEGFKLNPHVQGISEDGRIWVGYNQTGDYDNNNLFHPVKWVDGVPELLPMPEASLRGVPFINGCMARGCSADGSVIYGSSWDNLDFGMLYWKDGKVDWAGSDVRRIHTEINRYGEEEICEDAMRCMADLTQISPNGKWIAGAYRYEIMEDGNYHIETYPAVFNTETGKTVIIKDYGERVVSHITNDGIVCIANSSYLPDDGFMYDVNTQTNLGSVSEWIRSNYGIIAPRGYIRHISADGQYLMAHTLEPSALTVRVVGWYLAPALEK